MDWRSLGTLFACFRAWFCIWERDLCCKSQFFKLKKQTKYTVVKDTYPNIDLFLLPSSYHQMHYAMRFSVSYTENILLFKLLRTGLWEVIAVHIFLLGRGITFSFMILYPFSSMYPCNSNHVFLMRCSPSVPGFIPHSSRWPEKENVIN